MRKLFSYRSSLLLVAVAVAAIAVACGGGSNEPAATSISRSTATQTATATTVPPTQTATPSGLIGDVARGERLFTSEACSACHSTGDNSIVGPGLKGVSFRASERGGDAYVIESIKDPSAVIVKGFNPVMPNFSRLDDQEVADLVAYLNTLN